MILIETPRRVPKHTAEKINWRIEKEMQERLRHYTLDPQGIEQRLQDLDHGVGY
jgi:hypothetical protein